jgi:hypothetical protein
VVAGDGRGNEVRVSADNGGVDIVVAYRPRGGSFGPSRPIAHAGPRQAVCDVGVRMNRSREAFVAWDCDPSGAFGEGSFAQAALLDRKGRVESISGRHEALSAGYSLGLAFDQRGRAVAAWQAPDYDHLFSLIGAHGRFAGFRPIAHSRGMDATTIDVAIAPGGVGLATWANELKRRATRVRVASIRLPR